MSSVNRHAGGIYAAEKRQIPSKPAIATKKPDIGRRPADASSMPKLQNSNGNNPEEKDQFSKTPPWLKSNGGATESAFMAFKKKTTAVTRTVETIQASDHSGSESPESKKAWEAVRERSDSPPSSGSGGGSTIGIISGRKWSGSDSGTSSKWSSKTTSVSSSRPASVSSVCSTSSLEHVLRRSSSVDSSAITVYLAPLCSDPEYVTIDAQKGTRADELVELILQKINLGPAKAFELAETFSSGGQICKERRLDVHENPARLQLLWPRTASGAVSPGTIENVHKTEYRFYLRKQDASDGPHASRGWIEQQPSEIEKFLSSFLQPTMLREYPDLCNLPDLNEDTLMENLRARFAAGHIYTYVGTILIALNPFKFFPIYNPKYVRLYQNKVLSDLPPHIFAIADSAYHKMLGDRSNQCIVISGESGSGKTESTNLLLHHLSALSQRGLHTTGIEQTILGAGPVLEAFGNAKTVHNNNSSRFGKFIQVNYKENGMVHGAVVEKYLLEKSRIVFQAKNERNYHVFYYLLSGANSQEREEMLLLDPQDYAYLNQSGCVQLEDINGDPVDEAHEFTRLRQSMELVGFSHETQRRIYSVLAAVLYLGNVEYKKKADHHHHEAVTIKNQQTIKTISTLLKVKDTTLVEALTKKKTKAGGESVIMSYNLPDATATRDAMAKCLYGGLFDWIVLQVNHALLAKREFKEHQGKSIGVLDIFGFEDFGQNSFEQFCINYANEHLHYYFNQHIFKFEQEEYMREGILWKNIEYIDNTDCVQLFAKKRTGLLALLDEECNFPGATNETLLAKFHAQNQSSSYYEVPQMKEDCFLVRHYAGMVKYAISDFREKNSDLMRHDIMVALKNSSSAFVRELVGYDPVAVLRWAILRSFFRACFAFRDAGKRYRQAAASGQPHQIVRRHSTSPYTTACAQHEGMKKSKSFKPKTRATKTWKDLKALKTVSRGQTSAAHNSKGKTKAPSVSAQFNYSLSRLMETLNQANPFFIRCIKSNANKAPCQFDNSLVLRQLRYTGMLATVKIRQSGYNYRLSFDEFIQQYKILLTNGLLSSKDDVRQFLQQLDLNMENYQIGSNKIFLREAEKLLLDDALHRAIMVRIVVIQRWLKTHLERKRYQRMKSASVVIQSQVRSFLAQRRLTDLKVNFYACVLIQRVFRGFRERKRLQRMVDAVIVLQKYFRAYIARRYFERLKNEHLAELEALEKEHQELLARELAIKEHRARHDTGNQCADVQDEYEIANAIDSYSHDVHSRPVTSSTSPPTSPLSPSQRQSRLIRQHSQDKEMTDANHLVALPTTPVAPPTSPVDDQECMIDLGQQQAPTPPQSTTTASSKPIAAPRLSKPTRIVSPVIRRDVTPSLPPLPPTSLPPSHITTSPPLSPSSPASVDSPRFPIPLSTHVSPPDARRSTYRDTGHDRYRIPTSSPQPTSVSGHIYSSKSLQHQQQTTPTSAADHKKPLPYRAQPGPADYEIRVSQALVENEELPVYTSPTVTVNRQEKPLSPPLKRQDSLVLDDTPFISPTATLQSGAKLQPPQTITPPTSRHQHHFPSAATTGPMAVARSLSHSHTDGTEDTGSSDVGDVASPTATGSHFSHIYRAGSRIRQIVTGGRKHSSRRGSEDDYSEDDISDLPSPRFEGKHDVFKEQQQHHMQQSNRVIQSFQNTTQQHVTRHGRRIGAVGGVGGGMSTSIMSGIAATTTISSNTATSTISTSVSRMQDASAEVFNQLAKAKPSSPQPKTKTPSPTPASHSMFAGTRNKKRRKLKKVSTTTTTNRSGAVNTTVVMSDNTTCSATLTTTSGSWNVSSTSQWQAPTEVLVSSPVELQQLTTFIYSKIKEQKRNTTKRATVFDVVFNGALEEFHHNLITRTSLALGSKQDLQLCYRELLMNFEDALKYRSQDKCLEESFTATIGINALRGFLDEFKKRKESKDFPKAERITSKSRREKRKQDKSQTLLVQHGGHRYMPVQFSIPTYCEHCASIMWVIEKGFVCQDCRYTVHKKCSTKSTEKCKGFREKKEKEKSEKGVFGVALSQQVRPGHDMPQVLDRLFLAIENTGLHTEGLYRKTGAAGKVRQLKAELTENEQGTDLNQYHVHVLATVTKAYFRDLPEPLLTYDLYDDYLRVSECSDDLERFSSLVELCRKLPYPNRDVLERLIFHLAKVARCEQYNKMSANGLAIVFAPSLLRTSRNLPAQEILQHVPSQTKVISVLISSQINKIRSIIADIETLDSATVHTTERLESVRASRRGPAPTQQSESRSPLGSPGIGMPGAMRANRIINEEEIRLAHQLEHLEDQKQELTLRLPLLDFRNSSSEEDLLGLDAPVPAPCDDVVDGELCEEYAATFEVPASTNPTLRHLNKRRAPTPVKRRPPSHKRPSSRDAEKSDDEEVARPSVLTLPELQQIGDEIIV